MTRWLPDYPAAGNVIEPQFACGERGFGNPPVTNPVRTHAVSARVENVQLHPQWGLLLSRLWVQ